MKPATRSPRKGPEADLVQASIAAGLFNAGEAAPRLHFELDMETGFPDIVAVYKPSSLPPPKNDARFNRLDARVLHYLFSSGHADPATIAAAILAKPQHVARTIERLQETEKIAPVKRTSTYRLRSFRAAFQSTRIVSIEAKISNWRRAVEQAHANTWFSSHSFVLVPNSLKLMPALLEEARRFGVGVISFDGTRNRIVQRPTTHPIPKSYASWIVDSMS